MIIVRVRGHGFHLRGATRRGEPVPTGISRRAGRTSADHQNVEPIFHRGIHLETRPEVQERRGRIRAFQWYPQGDSNPCRRDENPIS